MPLHFDTLIDPETLQELIHSRELVLIDCRHTLDDTRIGELWYQRSHLPGAHFMHLDRDLSAAMTGYNGRHPLPDRATMATRFASIGVDASKQVVVYDQEQGAIAARAWWLLKWLGHERVAVLDGGFRAWCEMGGALTSDVAAAHAAQFELRAGVANVDAAFVLIHLVDGAMTLIDARSADRFRGKNETLDPVAGHIPGALNRPFAMNLAANRRFKSAEQLRGEFLALLGQHLAESVVHSCGSGVTACHNLLAMEVAGLKGSRLYGGSWSEWIADPSRPITR